MWRTWILLIGLAAALGLARPASAALIAHWPLDGDALDTADGHDGRLVGGADFVSDPERGMVLRVDGITGHVAVPDAKDLDFTRTSTFTLAAWVYIEAVTGTWQGIMSKSREQGDHYGIWVTDAGDWMGGGWENRGSKVPTKVWVHVAHVHNGPAGVSTTYVNGVADWTGGLRSSFTTAGVGEFWIGGAQLPPGYAHEMFGGMIDDVRVYDSALTAAEIKALVPPKLKASHPVPADGALSVSAPLLQWDKGETAIFHDVYVGTTPELTAANKIASRQPFLVAYLAQGLQPGVTYYWRVDEIDAAGNVETGDVWSFIAQAATAYHPTPADGAVDAGTTLALSWLPGQTATTHHLYFGDSAETVALGAADTDKGELTDLTFDPGTLESLTTYYWRVDEIVAGGAVRTGPLWKFTTHLVVDDFESYTDDVGSAVFDVWIDGLANGQSGSVVGYDAAPFTEQQIVHGGAQSMPFDYNNVNAPFYSEAEREFASAQDWTANGAGALVLYVRGRVGNTAAPLYVALEDASKHTAVVACSDPGVTTSIKWTAWRVPLSDFAGVNLAKVKKLVLGVGDRQNPTKGGAGRIYVDDICLTQP
jgi:hypothetical protein